MLSFVQSPRASLSLLSLGRGTRNDIDMKCDEQVPWKSECRRKTNGSRSLASAFTSLSRFSPAEQRKLFGAWSEGMLSDLKKSKRDLQHEKSIRDVLNCCV